MMQSSRAQGKCQLCLQFLEKHPMVAPFIPHFLQRIRRPLRQAEPIPATTPSPVGSCASGAQRAHWSCTHAWFPLFTLIRMSSPRPLSALPRNPISFGSILP